MWDLAGWATGKMLASLRQYDAGLKSPLHSMRRWTPTDGGLSE
jgi:hypothetical protein